MNLLTLKTTLALTLASLTLGCGSPEEAAFDDTWDDLETVEQPAVFQHVCDETTLTLYDRTNLQGNRICFIREGLGGRIDLRNYCRTWFRNVCLFTWEAGVRSYTSERDRGILSVADVMSPAEYIPAETHFKNAGAVGRAARYLDLPHPL